MKDYDIHMNIKTGRKLDRKEKAVLKNAIREYGVSVRDIRTSDQYAIVLGNVFDHDGKENVVKGAFNDIVEDVRKLYPGAYVDMYWTEIPESEYFFSTDDVRD